MTMTLEKLTNVITSLRSGAGHLPNDASADMVRKIYLMAHRLKCKGITIYRYGSKEDQVLSFGAEREWSQTATPEMVRAESEYAGGCASGTCPF